MHDNILHDEPVEEAPKTMEPWWDVPVRSLETINPEGHYVPSGGGSGHSGGGSRSGGGMSIGSWGMAMGMINLINCPD